MQPRARGPLPHWCIGGSGMLHRSHTALQGAYRERSHCSIALQWGSPPHWSCLGTWQLAARRVCAKERLSGKKKTQRDRERNKGQIPTTLNSFHQTGEQSPRFLPNLGSSCAAKVQTLLATEMPIIHGRNHASVGDASPSLLCIASTTR